MHNITTITAHLLDQEHDQATHELISVINQLVLASKIVSKDINRAGLTAILGSTGSVNIQDEEQQKLDAYADDLFIEILRQSPYVAAVATEEKPDLIPFDDDFHKNGQYIVYMDPIDGSSNIDVNVSIGTNFAIFRRKSSSGPLTKNDYLQPGKNVIAAGYVVYGASTMLVYSIGNGVHGFTLEPSIGEFLLSHPDITIPNKLSYYSINEAYEPKWDAHTQQFVAQLKQDHDAPSARYIGSLVADFHRNLLKGGIYLYPADKKQPQGKLRLLYEAIPFSYLAAQAGGYGSDGKQSILEINPQKIHQRTPLIVGNTKQVINFEKTTQV
jgi:fructose-1,6-bisphosphatase I